MRAPVEQRTWIPSQFQATDLDLHVCLAHAQTVQGQMIEKAAFATLQDQLQITLPGLVHGLAQQPATAGLGRKQD